MTRTTSILIFYVCILAALPLSYLHAKTGDILKQHKKEATLEVAVDKKIAVISSKKLTKEDALKLCKDYMIKAMALSTYVCYLDGREIYERTPFDTLAKPVHKKGATLEVFGDGKMVVLSRKPMTKDAGLKECKLYEQKTMFGIFICFLNEKEIYRHPANVIPIPKHTKGAVLEASIDGSMIVLSNKPMTKDAALKECKLFEQKRQPPGRYVCYLNAVEIYVRSNAVLLPEFLMRSDPLVKESAHDCIIGAKIISDGDAVRLYKDNVVAQGDECKNVSEVRRCINGELSGDPLYRYRTCEAAKGKASCMIGKLEIKSGDTQKFFKERFVAKKELCSTLQQNRTCNNGILGGDASFLYGSCIERIISGPAKDF
jgi:hypothetical protein